MLLKLKTRGFRSSDQYKTIVRQTDMCTYQRGKISKILKMFVIVCFASQNWLFAEAEVR